MSTTTFDLVVIGGGIVGLATAYTAARRFPGIRLLVLEKEQQPGTHQTGHNSGVIHSGIYYKPGSLKAQNCVRGRAMLLDFAREHAIPHEVCGKIIVATHEGELPALERIHERGRANSVEGLALLDEHEIRQVEPHCKGVRAILVPGAGIINYAKVAATLASLIRRFPGAEVRTGEQVTGISKQNGITTIHTGKNRYSTARLIACAGLHADRIAQLDGLEPGLRIVGFRGDYYELAPTSQHLVRSLIYPVPDPQFPFLGVHFTRMIDGGVECGPNAVFSFKREGYGKTDFDLRDATDALSYGGLWKLFARHWKYGLGEYRRAFSKQRFLHSLRQLVPDLAISDIVPARAGVRAVALAPDGSMIDDFAIVHTDTSIHVLSAPSPAATSSLSIGTTVCDMAAQQFHW
jgi:L-2-hydroxyglutarate oxidase